MLDARVATEFKRVLPIGSTVYEVGGTASISSAVDSAVRALGYPTVRLGGADRFATSVAIANALPAATKAVVVTGLTFADALGAGAAAGAWTSPVLLSNGPTLPASVKSFLDAHPSLQVWGVGGQGAAAAKAYITSPDRSIVGADRYDTASKLAAAFFPSPTFPVVVSGLNYPDGLSGGLLAAAPLLVQVRRVARLQRERDLGGELFILDRVDLQRHVRVGRVIRRRHLLPYPLQRVGGGVVPPRERYRTARVGRAP